MADIDYPVDLPMPLGGQFAESILETKVRDSGDVGAPRQRNRFTRALERFSYQLMLTEPQKLALAAFYDVDLVRGVKSFNWTHPTTAVTYEAVMPSRPAIKHMTAGFWTADVEIEQI